MKSTQLLSVVLSLIMVFGVSAGSAFAETDDAADNTSVDAANTVGTTVEEYDEVIDETDADDVGDETDEAEDEREDYDEDYARDGKPYDLDDRLTHWCGLSDEEKRQFFEDHPRFEQFADRLADYCDLPDYTRDSKFKDFIRLNVTDEDREKVREHVKDHIKDKVRDNVKDYVKDYVKDHKGDGHFNLDERIGYYCDMSDEEKRQFYADHPRLEKLADRLENYCSLSEEDRRDKIRDLVRDHVTDEDRDRNVDSDFRGKLARWCDATDADKEATAAKYDKTEDQIAKAERYCILDETDRADFIAEHRDEFKDHMKDRMMDKMSDKRPHMDYDRLCALADSDRAAEITDSAKLDRISNWCDMTPEEREDYKRDHQGEMKDKMKDKMHDKMSDVAKDRMSDVAKDRLAGKMSDMSPRLKAMIMEKHDISDERMDEIKMKYREKHGELSDEKRSDLKMKYRDHMSKVRDNLSDDRKSDIHDRIAEMKAFKADLRERASSMTDEEKQELREEFIEKAKDMQLAWISPRVQMHAGVDSADIECREGFSLVMKASNGVAMCLKADTALKMIDRGLVVPTS